MTASMVEKIAQWIRSNESKGYTEEELKKRLLVRGYNADDVAEAIKLTKSERKAKNIVLIKDIFKNMLKPTFLKIFLTAIVLLSTIIFFITAPYFYQYIGQVSCKTTTYVYDAAQYNANVINPAQSSDTPPAEFIKLLGAKEKYDNNFRNNVYAARQNLDRVAIITYAISSTSVSRIQVLNPIFPVPCRLTVKNIDLGSDLSGFQSRSDYCYDFYSKEDRKCTEDAALKYASLRQIPDDNCGVNGNCVAKDQIHVGLLWTIITGFLLLAFFYLLLCILIASLDSLLILGRGYLVMSFIILFFMLLIFGGFDEYLAFFIGLVMILQILIFIDSVKVRNIVLISMFVLTVVIMFTSMSNVVLVGSTGGSYSIPMVYDYNTIYCNNTKTLSEMNLLYKDPQTEYFHEDINVSYGMMHNLSVCYEPNCNSVCHQRADGIGGSYYTLAGIKPSCVCQYSKLE